MSDPAPDQTAAPVAEAAPEVAAPEAAANGNADSNDSDSPARKKSKTDARARWPALESNPESFTKFMRKIGVPESVSVCDVWGLDPDLLAMCLPLPPYAMIFLYPTTGIKREKRTAESESVLDPGTIL